MAKINFLTAYPTATPVASSIVIGSIAANGATNNFLMSDIAAYVMSANTLTLQDVCDNGSVTTTGITVAGTTTLNGALDANSTADIADTLTLSKATGTGLDVTADALINGDANIGGTLITNAIEADTGNLVINDSGGTERVRVTAAGALTVQGDASFTEKFILSAGAPSSASDTGTKDEVAIDANYIYICTATNTWKRVAIASWV